MVLGQEHLGKMINSCYLSHFRDLNMVNTFPLQSPYHYFIKPYQVISCICQAVVAGDVGICFDTAGIIFPITFIQKLPLVHRCLHYDSCQRKYQRAKMTSSVFMFVVLINKLYKVQMHLSL